MSKQNESQPQPGPFFAGLILGGAIVAAAVAASGIPVRTRYAETPYNRDRHIELTTPDGSRCRLSGPGRFDVLNAAYPNLITEPTQ